MLAYGDEVARPDLALQAASEAFAAFRIAVATADQADALDPEAALLHATREAAARHAENPYRPSGRERPERRTTACELMPRLLVAWTEGRLSVEDEQRLVRHLRRCPDCRALKDAFARAEERYRGGSGATLDSTETSVIVSTMAAVQIPVAGAAPAPEPTAAEGAAPAPDASPEPPVAADAADLADV
ncbi:zf-HC2 domain-containing protein, partial [Patulibacter medicamentivorans]|uniref:zf-HC2 domain-containing protein n=1 Tax=Patulibacter medicamentivorans TaxID=1097667 RepID=UPI001110C43B